MAVVKAILFWSKHDTKSKQLRQLVQEINADLDLVCVDSSAVKNALIDDEQYGIDRIPAVLVLYSNGMHNTITGKKLDPWFNELISNIQQIASVSGSGYAPLQQQTDPTGMTQISPEQPEIGSGYKPENPMMAAMMSEHIKGAAPAMDITSDPHVQLGRREIKQEGMSAKDLAKRMQEARDAFDEQVDANKPFL